MSTKWLSVLYDSEIKRIRLLIDITKEKDATNSQEFLNFLDKINELSVEF